MCLLKFTLLFIFHFLFFFFTSFLLFNCRFLFLLFPSLSFPFLCHFPFCCFSFLLCPSCPPLVLCIRVYRFYSRSLLVNGVMAVRVLLNASVITARWFNVEFEFILHRRSLIWLQNIGRSMQTCEKVTDERWTCRELMCDHLERDLNIVWRVQLVGVFLICPELSMIR